MNTTDILAKLLHLCRVLRDDGVVGRECVNGGCRRVHCLSLVLCVSVFAFAVTVGSSSGRADEQETRPLKQAKSTTPAETAKAQPEDNTALPVIADLLDGAQSAEAALAAYVSASNAGDAEAALLMVDPPIRRLLMLEMAIERFAIRSSILERGLFGKREFEVGGMLFHCAGRELVRVRSIKQLNTRHVDNDRVVFTVLTTARSYHEDKDMHNVIQVLTVQRSGKWYVFRPFGLLTLALREPNGQSPVLRVKRGSEQQPNRENADFEIEYLVPIEVIHEHLVRAANDPEIEQSLQLAQKLDRYYASVVNRAIREDYTSRRELLTALDLAHNWIHELSDKGSDTLMSTISELAQQAPRQPDAEKGKPKNP